MHPSRPRPLRLLSLLILPAVLVACSTARNTATPTSSIVGAWQSDTPFPGGEGAQLKMIFGRDGTFTALGVSPAGEEEIGDGAWAATGPASFRIYADDAPEGGRVVGPDTPELSGGDGMGANDAIRMRRVPGT